MKDYYKILGLNKDDLPDTIKQRFKELAFENHPDVSDKKNAAENFIEIYEAYHILIKPEKRGKYDLLYGKYIDKTGTLIQDEENLQSDIRNVSGKARENAEQKARIRYRDFIKDLDCYFTEGLKADGTPYSYNMHKTTGISGGIGPMGSIKARIVSIPVPRSKKALQTHRIGFLIKVVFFTLAIAVLQLEILAVQGLITKMLIFISIITTGGIAAHITYHFTATRSKFFSAKNFILVKKYRKNGFKRGFNPMFSTTPVGAIAYLFRLVF